MCFCPFLLTDSVARVLSECRCSRVPRSRIPDPRSKISGSEYPYWVELLITSVIIITGDAEIQRTPAALVLVLLVVLAAIALPGYGLSYHYIDVVGRKRLQGAGFCAIGTLYLATDEKAAGFFNAFTEAGSRND